MEEFKKYDNESNKNSKGKLKKWCREHKKELLTTSISVVVFTGIIIGWSKQRTISFAKGSERIILPQSLNSNKVVSSSLKENKYKDVPGITIKVRGHIRNLPESKHASPEKIKMAIDEGIKLEPGQTLVIPYTRGEVA